MSFLNENPSDERDNGFPLSIENEISQDLATEFDSLNGYTFEQLKLLKNNEKSDLKDSATKAYHAILEYCVTIVRLSEVQRSDEFNLQFLRLNLGTLINAGEKLHAMLGTMRDVVFADDGIGKHPFFDCVRIPTRRYAKELTAAQVLLQVFYYPKAKEFSRARHVELQQFLKQYQEMDTEHPVIKEVKNMLDALNAGASVPAKYLRNRAVTVSLILLAWQRKVPTDKLNVEKFWKFTSTFMQRLEEQVEKMKTFNPDTKYYYLVEFQRHLTQAAVERPALTRRHEILSRNLDQWLKNGKLEGD